MFYEPVTIADAHDMGVPESSSMEFAYYEQHGMPLPCGGPVYPDLGPDPDWPEPEPAPEPCGGPPTEAFLGMPPRWQAHERWCWDVHAPDADGCPPPF